MARINIEDTLFRDRRFTDLCIKLGSRPLALGWLVEAWILAQEQVCAENPHGKISVEKWESHRMCDLIIEVGLATCADRQVELAGADESFKWLTQRQEAASKGGLARAEKYKNSASSNVKASEIVPVGSRSASGLSPLTLPLSLTPNKENLTLITRYVEEGESRKEEPAAVNKSKFRIHKDLSDPGINDILATISEATQSRWVRSHDPIWVRETLKEAISFYTARGDDLTDGWGVVLHKALQRAKAAKEKANGGRLTMDSVQTDDFWAKVFPKSEGVAT